MNSTDQKQHGRSGKDQADGQGEGRQDPFEAASPQPKHTPTRKPADGPDDDKDDKEERSDLADIGEADEQDGAVEGMKQGAPHQDPPATLSQEQRRERRNNL